MLWQCDDCPALFPKFEDLKAHEASCQERLLRLGESWRCTKHCRAMFPTLEEVKAHEASCKKKAWQCDHCPAQFSTFDEAKSHEASCEKKSEADNLRNDENKDVQVDNFHNKDQCQCRVCGTNCFLTRAEAAYRVCDECASEVYDCEPHELEGKIDDDEVDEKYRADRDKRYEGIDMLLATRNVIFDVVGLFAIAENIDSVVFALNRPGWAFRQTTKAKKWIPPYPKVHLQKAIEQMKELPEKIRQSSERFCQFETSPNHHPYHLHKKSLSKLSQQTEQESTSFLTRYDELPDSFTSDSQVVDIRKHIIESTIPTFSKVARKIRALITLTQFSHDKMYSKTHAINEALKYRKCTPERGAAIKEMVLMKCVPSKTAFYEAINKFEKEEGNVMIDCWNSKTGPLKRGFLRKMSNGNRWLAHVLMPAIPVDCDSDGNPIMDRISIPQLYSTPEIVDISDYMGLIKGSTGVTSKIGVGGRIYFSPHQFPTPLNLNIAGSANDKVFQRLKKCIQKCCEDAGSPVVCNGGKVGSKKFVCSHKMRARKRKLDTEDHYTCRYSFTVKWDKLGYYIALRNERKQSGCFVGYEFHNHK